MIFHVPHSATHIPAELRGDILLDDEALALELLRMTDHYTDELFTRDLRRGDHALVFPVSRLVVDVERFEDDADEPMAERGMGVIYTATSDLTPLRSPPRPEAREALLGRFYRAHHRKLEALVEQDLSSGCDRALIIDCHSFPAKPLPYEPVQDTQRPDICIGTDGFHTPGVITQVLVTHFQAKGYVVEIDTPFAGSMVPSADYRRDRRVCSVMIEINRGRYLEGSSGEKSGGFVKLREDIGEAISLLRSYQEQPGELPGATEQQPL